jgi:hypothetical protein
MSYVDGSELDDLLKASGGFLPETQALRIIRDIADALRYAWDKFRILHRDIKPANIMVTSDGVAKLMDMGISKSMSEDSGLTMTGVVIGTPYYMSPEQARADGELDCRSDIYALGSTLYHTVTGQVPYDATTAMGILAKHITDPFPPPRDRNPGVSEECSVLLEIMMAKKPDDRQRDWSAVIQDIDLVLSGEFPVTPRPEIGKSQVMQMTASQALPRRKIMNRPPKARRHDADETGGVDEIPSEPSVPKGKSSLALRLGAVAGIGLLLIVGAILLVVKGTTAPEPEAVLSKGGGIVIAEPGGTGIPAAPAAATDATGNDPVHEMMEFAADYAKKNPEDFDRIIANYRKIQESGKGSKYELMADAAITETKRRQAERESEKVQALAAEEAKKQAAKEAKKQELAELEAKRLVAEAARKQVEAAEAQKRELAKRQEEAAAEKVRELLAGIADLVIRGDFTGARKSLPADAETAAPGITALLDGILSIDKAALESVRSVPIPPRSGNPSQNGTFPRRRRRNLPRSSKNTGARMRIRSTRRSSMRRLPRCSKASRRSGAGISTGFGRSKTPTSNSSRSRRGNSRWANRTPNAKSPSPARSGWENTK